MVPTLHIPTQAALNDKTVFVGEATWGEYVHETVAEVEGLQYDEPVTAH
jgi:hypothetical protein